MDGSAESRIERNVHGVPLWLLRAYLEELGGHADGEQRVVGEGWQARLSKIEDYRIGSLRVGRVRLELWGEPEAVAQLMAPLELKLLRGGG